MKESDIQRAILDYLAAKRILAFRMNSGAMFGSHKGKKWAVRFGEPGMADILASTTGGGELDVWWIEVKSEKGKQSEEQKSFQRLVENHGHGYILARSVDDVMAILR